MFSRIPVILALLFGLLAPVAQAVAKGPTAARLIKALGDPSPKVRIKAATRLGQEGVVKAVGRLQGLADSARQPEAVRAACLLALARLKDEGSRRRMGILVGHRNELIAMAAEKGLLLLDKALPAEPVYLMEFSPAAAPKGLSPKLAKQVDQAFLRRVRQTDGVVEGAGEDGVLSDRALSDHLEKRRLTGLRMKPEIISLDEQNEPGRTTILAQIKIASFYMPGKQPMAMAVGGADAWIGDERITELERRDLQKEVLDQAADSALMQLLQTLADEAR